jgi:release factor glutamine methyltransferase
VSVPLPPLLREWTGRLAAAGVPSPASDTRWLAGHVLRRAPSELVLHESVSPDQLAQIDALVTRRERREPLQHILGSAPFLDLDLAVGPGVFVPRPETEVLADFVIGWLRGLPTAAAGITVVDFCSGSGALALGIACHVEHVHVTAVECSAAALRFARGNVEAAAGRLAVRASTVTLVHADVTAGAGGFRPGTVDAVVCNPPYIPDGAVPRDPEVRDHDPAGALYGGPDGLSVIRPVIAVAAEILRPRGLIAIEHGDLQGGEDGVPGLLAASPEAGARYRDVVDHADLAGRPRFTTAVRR